MAKPLFHIGYFIASIEFMNRKQRTMSLIKQLDKRILVLDGATGTALQKQNLTARDFGGEKLDGCNENLVLVRPDIIREVHDLYLKSGCDIIETNSFGGTPLVLAEYDLQDKCYEINFKSAQIAREIADEHSKLTPDKPRFVAGSMGPTTKALSVTGGISFNELLHHFCTQAKGLYDGGIDYFLLETCNDTRNIKAGLIGINKFLSEQDEKIPVAVSVTIEMMGTMLAGQTIEALITSLENVELLYIGLNCATGPELMTDHIRSLSKMANTRVACVPNAGLPDENGNYLETPQMLTDALERFVDNSWINVLGGCCGTSYEHINAISEMAASKKPRSFENNNTSRLSGLECLEITDEKRPILVGERTNSIGSKKFRNLIADKKFDEAAEIAKAQVAKGAHIIDVCLANPDSNEHDDMENFLERLIQKIKAPIMIDSTNEKVIETALTYCQGKTIINSINLENGEERYKKVIPLAKKYGAALVVGTIDDNPEQGMAFTRERKLEVAKRSHELLTKTYGVPESDIYFDALVFPCATGSEEYAGSAIETIEGLRLIKKEFPNCKNILGVSNVSFGLPLAGREVLNSVFLHHCVQAGLDLAIVNTQKIKPFSSLGEEEIKLAEDLLFNRVPDSVTAFAEHFRGKKSVKSKVESDIPLEKRISQYVLDGIKTGLHKDLDKMVETTSAIDIINGPLMDGMKEVGKLFNGNKLIVAEVLQSAEVMKAAVNHLQTNMTQGQENSKGKILLATVKGDVHDIGKNLVDIILSNNGFEVIDIGIKITSEQLIQAAREHKPDIIGLSGLLVKSAHQMTTSAEDLAKAGIQAPILVGGAALSKNFVMNKIDPAYMEGKAFYAKDAMHGLSLANRIVDKDEFHKLLKEINESKGEGPSSSEEHKSMAASKSPLSTKRSTLIRNIQNPPKAPDFEKHVMKDTPIDLIFNHINPRMLYKKHLGVGVNWVKKISENNLSELQNSPDGKKAYEIYLEVEKVKEEYKNSHLIPSAVYQYFKCYSEENSIHILNQKEQEISRLTFQRQNKPDGLCLSDYVTPKEMNVVDNFAMFVVSVGKNIRKETQKLMNDGNYLRSHILSALAIECAEAYAEIVHLQIQKMWCGQKPYSGKRYSFGHSACPELEKQKILWELLSPSESIDVKLTESMMMDPEASVSAMVFHHPDARYFNVSLSNKYM